MQRAQESINRGKDNKEFNTIKSMNKGTMPETEKRFETITNTMGAYINQKGI